MFCQECGTKFAEGTTTCSQCGPAANQVQNSGALQASPPNPPSPPSPPNPPNPPSQDNIGSFLSFDVMITPMIMKIIYIVGSVIIALAALVAMFTGGVPGFFGGLIGGAIMLIFFRVWCEILILFFKMRTEIQQIRNNTAQK